MSGGAADRERTALLEDLASGDEEVRRLAVERLASLPSAEAVPRLVQCLGDPGWRVRKAAVERLVASSETDRVAGALVGALADGDNPGRRNAAVEALVRSGAPMLPRLIASLGSDDVDVRKLVVDAIAGVGDPGSCEPVMAVLADDDPNVRAAAADALGIIGGEGAVEALLAVAVRDDEDRLVRFAALRALGELEAPLRVAQLGAVLDDPTLRAAGFAGLGRLVDDEEALDRLLKALGSGARATREAAMEALLRWVSVAEEPGPAVDRIRGAVRALPDFVARASERLESADLSGRMVGIQFLGLAARTEAVLPLLHVARDEAVREIAHGALEAMGEAAEEALADAFGQLDCEQRVDACALLARLGGDAGAAALRGALDAPDMELRAAAARALGARRCADALPELVRRLELAAAELDGEEESAALVDALVEIAALPESAARAVELLAHRLEGAPDALRLSVARALARIGRPDDDELVATLMKDPSAAVRRAAVEALSRLDGPRAEEPLRLALADEAPAVRMAAAQVLGASGDSLVDLQRLLDDEDERVRAAAVRAIGRVAATRPEEATLCGAALAAVSGVLDDAAPVAMAAVESLEAVGGSDAAHAVRIALTRPEPELVQAAVSCLGRHANGDDLQQLLPLISHEAWAVRAEAITALAERRVAQSVPPILRRLETEQDQFVRDAILQALKRLEE